LPVEVEVVTVSEEAQLEDPAIVRRQCRVKDWGRPGMRERVKRAKLRAALAENSKIATPQPSHGRCPYESIDEDGHIRRFEG